jgi:hypothetical protein
VTGNPRVWIVCVEALSMLLQWAALNGPVMHTRR